MDYKGEMQKERMVIDMWPRRIKNLLTAGSSLPSCPSWYRSPVSIISPLSSIDFDIQIAIRLQSHQAVQTSQQESTQFNEMLASVLQINILCVANLYQHSLGYYRAVSITVI